jgi:hypothetical protein
MRSDCPSENILVVASNDYCYTWKRSSLARYRRLRYPYLVIAISLLAIPTRTTQAQADKEPATIPCSVCFDGSPITQPDELLEIPGIGSLPCGTVEGLAGTLYRQEDADCQLLQSVGRICGCPSMVLVDEGSCDLCGTGASVPGARSELPLTYLNDVVNYEGVNCRLLEAYLETSIATTNTTCQLGQAWTRDYCCSSAVVVAPVNPCEVCVEAPTNALSLGGLELSCAQIQQAASTLWESNESTCNQVQSLTALSCGCTTAGGGGGGGSVELTVICFNCADDATMW